MLGIWIRIISGECVYQVSIEMNSIFFTLWYNACYWELCQAGFHSYPPPPPGIAVAGSIFGSSETAVLERSVSRDYFKEHRKLPDWTSADPDDWERLRAIPTRKLLPSSPSSFTTRQLSSGRSS